MPGHCQNIADFSAARTMHTYAMNSFDMHGTFSFDRFDFPLDIIPESIVVRCPHHCCLSIVISVDSR